MKLLTYFLLLGLTLSLTYGAPTQDPIAEENAHAALPDRCSGIEFDAIAPDEKGTAMFFKGDHVWKGFHGDAQPTFKELHASDHIDAAFRMHRPENPEDHDHIIIFLDDKVFSFYNETLEDGYPKPMTEDFPGLPSHLDAAVECPKSECHADSVLFFKGHDVHVHDIQTKTVKTKTWSHLPVCTSAFRWLDHYYCFHGHNFTRFNPHTGEVGDKYPKDARNYFMRCDNFGHGHGYKAPKCNETKLDAITSDDTGKMYLFAGPIYMRLDTARDGLHAFPIWRTWKEMTHGVDAVFSYTDKTYMIKDDNVYIYRSGAQYTLIEGYPKLLHDELGIDGKVDAAFVCPSNHTVHIIQGEKFREIDLTATPRTVVRDLMLPFSDVDAAHCSSDGIRVFKGAQYFKYESPKTLAMSRIMPMPHNIMPEEFGCTN